jgi:hypothetical protein
MLDAVSSRVILKGMSINPNHCFLFCIKAGLEHRMASSPKDFVVSVANDHHFVTEQTLQ